MSEDTELLRQFAEKGSQAAFAELVQRKVGLVYAAALRQTGGDAHLAQDVVQGVFIALAASAARLQRHAMLTGWLFTTTRHLAIGAMRRQRRWQRREQAAEIMKANEDDSKPWAELRPVIDEALHELGEKDRSVLLLRFFDGRSLAEVGAAIGLAENSARMRVDRALDKLRTRLARRGITSTAAALGLTLANQPAIAVPAGLAASAVGGGIAAATVGGGAAAAAAWWLVHFMNSTKLVLGAIGLVAAVGLGAWLGVASQRGAHPAGVAQARSGVSGELAALRAENQRLRDLFGRGPAERASPLGRGGAPAAGEAETSRDFSTLRILIDLRRRKLANLEFEFLSEGARLEPAFAELFGLSPAELSTLQQAIDAAGEQVGALVRQNTTMQRAPNGDVLIAVKPFPETGGAAYDALLKTFADTLGPERHNAFLALGAEQVEKALGRFGTSERSIVLSRENTAGEVRYRINDRTRNGPRDNSNYVSDRLTPERFLREIGPLAELLPGDFAPRR